jgi:hypothetical protein
MPRKVHYVLSTHWDREWYQSQQDYRFRLVRLMDNVLAGWKDERLQGPFQTDGQSIVLEDYLEVRPERREQIQVLLKDGHFVSGPWYVLPDEFLVSGESIVRNLELGRRMVRQMGAEPSNAGFLCDMFGHNSQMPQIFKGFGIPVGFVWRGNNLIDQRQVIWRGADGTELLCYRFGEVGYCTYAFQARQAHLGKPPSTEAETRARQQAFLENESKKSQVGPLLAFDGGDHQEWDPEDYAVLSERFVRADSDFEVVHSSLDAYIREYLPYSSQITARFEGELRDPALQPDAVEAQWLIPGVGSSRVRIKQANADCQNLLCQWAEPFSVFASAVTGSEYPGGYLDVAWKWLLQNHPHDSICGCSIDAVHEDMVYRFHQTEQIASHLAADATRRLAASVTGEPGEKEVRVGVFNPLPQALDDVVDLDLELPRDWPLFNEMSNSEEKIAFRIYNAQGAELPYQRLAQVPNRARWNVFYTSFAQEKRVNVVRVSLPLHVPALGYTTLSVRAGEPGLPTRHPMAPGLVTGERTMENEALRVAIEPDGMLTISDKSSGQIYKRLLTFEDCADIGDGWNHGPVLNDARYFSPGNRTAIALLSNGRYKATFRVRTTMELPEEFDFAEMGRSEHMTGMVIDSLVTLLAGSERVEVETTVHNTVKDHRLRVLFPSGTSAQTYIADSPFDVVERPIALRADNYLYREPEIEPKPQQTFTAVFDALRGLAVMSTGLYESGVVDQPERPLALTLFRATRKTVGTNGEPGGQVQGELHFKIWIAPLSGEPDRARLLRWGQQLSGGTRAVYLNAVDTRRFRGESPLPAEDGFLTVAGAAVLTSLRQTPDGLEARLLNPNETQSEVTLKVKGLQTAQGVDFEHHAVGKSVRVDPLRGEAVLSLRPKQILTVRVSTE